MPDMRLTDSPPDSARLKGIWQYGRYRHPIGDPAIAAPGRLGRFRLKEWHYTSVATPRWFFAFAAVNLGYAAKVFAYLVDRERPGERNEYSVLAPLARGLTFAPSSVRGETAWRAGRDRLRARYQNGWQIELDLPFRSGRVSGAFQVEDAEALALLFQLPNNQPAYTHKASGLRTTGGLTFGSQKVDLNDGTGTLDWTRSVALRETRWQWCSLAGVAGTGERIGVNLSAQVYDDPSGISLENGLWLGGKVHTLAGVDFQLPSNPRKETWKIHSKSGNEVDLEFTPLGTREEQLNLGIIKSDFIQPYGNFRGLIRKDGNRPVDVTGLFGVVEKHLSVW